ncbi:hypothetical protein VNO77_36089 [Canavalia gladiata]|uniref:Uncharacterized protein n=1 Tax=Canavalia gladiata TaxID=3824 RepID=A0AAN9K7G1_CANGL
MASLQPPWFSSLRVVSPAKTTLLPSTNFKPAKLCCAMSPDNAESTSPNAESNSPNAESNSPNAPLDPVKLALSKAKAYRESMKSNSDSGIKQSATDDNSVKSESVVDEEQKDMPPAVKIAMEKAKKYKQNKGLAVGETTQGLQEGSERTWEKNVTDNTVDKKGEVSFSKMDFVGLEFADKKRTRGVPPGLLPVSDPFFDDDGDFPEVELIVGDPSKFDGAATAPKPPQQTKEDDSDLYKPKVSSWGVFPRPSNISKTFGGGRDIRPGDVLETEEEKAVKETRTKKLLAAYKKKKTESYIDPKIKSECEEALKDGDSLMNVGKLKEALPYYEKVMDKLTFQTELHGLAALQWSICQDSLCRSNEVRSMYEKLRSHPNANISKKARHFADSFKAMEMMKVKTGSPFYLKNLGYQSYFDAFIEKKSNYPIEDGLIQESAMNQVLPYILFLLSPIFVVLLIAVQKRI